jgi:hypothetical protein
LALLVAAVIPVQARLLSRRRSTMATRTRRAPAKAAPTPEPEAARANPRTQKSQEKLQLACTLISELLKGGEWVSSNDIHRALSGKVSEGMFGRAKQALGIEHRRIRGENGAQAQYEWRLPAKAK